MPGAGEQADRSTVVVAGTGSHDDLPEFLDRLDTRRALLIHDPNATAIAGDIRDLMGDRCVATYDGLRRNVATTESPRALELAAAVSADGVVSVGGGAATGLAKMASARLGLPFLAIPTTLAGVEMTSRYVARDAHGLVVGWSPAAAARVVFHDPDLLRDVSTAALVSSGVGAVVRGVEVLLAGDAAARRNAENGVRWLWEALPLLAGTMNVAYVRAQALSGAAVAGAALEIAGPGPIQVIAEELGSLSAIPDGELMVGLAGRSERIDERLRAVVGARGDHPLTEFANGLDVQVDVRPLLRSVDTTALAERLSRRSGLKTQIFADILGSVA
jgi:maleylacetate reductase